MRITYEKLPVADLYVDAVYESNGAPNLKGDVLSKLLQVGNMSGFRRLMVLQKSTPKELAYIVLESTNRQSDWLDYIDLERGNIQYYGDNREPGRELHDTKQSGNRILKEMFEKLFSDNRSGIPPIFYFESEKGRNRRFIGLVVPGDSRMRPEDQLVAIWRSKNGERYQNYKAIFTILDIPKISRKWISDLQKGIGYTSFEAPLVWKKWIEQGVYTPLCANDKVVKHRTKLQQVPNNEQEVLILKTIYNYFKNPFDFEYCAIKIVEMMDSNIHELAHTRAIRDGGRDAIGKYRLGRNADGIDVEFALEAKCYDLNNGVGVTELSRLISRLRFRQFGILVTTSYLENQAYRELKDDQHPIIVVSGVDIVKILNQAGIKTRDETVNWLKSNFRGSS